jgi:hypothetical protein
VTVPRACGPIKAREADQCQGAQGPGAGFFFLLFISVLLFYHKGTLHIFICTPLALNSNNWVPFASFKLRCRIISISLGFKLHLIISMSPRIAKWCQ